MLTRSCINGSTEDREHTDSTLRTGTMNRTPPPQPPQAMGCPGLCPKSKTFELADMAKKVKVEIGDIVLVPATQGKFGVTKVVFISKRYRDLVMLKVYKIALDNASMPDMNSGPFVDFIFGSRQTIESGRWIKVGNIPLTGDEKGLFHVIIGGNIIFEDEYIRPATEDDYKKYIQMSASGDPVVEAYVTEVLGLGTMAELLSEPQDEGQKEKIDTINNGPALDWLDGLLRSRTDKLIRRALEKILAGKYLEADDCQEALVAAEVVAAMKGAPAKELPDDTKEWIAKRKMDASQELIENAKRAVTQILTESELKELWEEGEDAEKWKASVNDLLRRLR